MNPCILPSLQMTVEYWEVYMSFRDTKCEPLLIVYIKQLINFKVLKWLIEQRKIVLIYTLPQTLYTLVVSTFPWKKLLNKFSLFIQGHLSNLKILYIWHFNYNTMVGRLLKNSRSGHICVQQRIFIFNNCIFVELQGITLIQLQRRNYIHSTSRKI